MLLRAPSAYGKAGKAKLRWCRRQLLGWYCESDRKFAWRLPGASTYQRILAEVLLQRTQAKTVDRFFAPFFQQFGDWRDIHSAKVIVLGRSLKRIGLWRRRA